VTPVSYNGILIVDKPAEWTSHDVVQKTKNMLGGCKVGHTGTLDPFATGVLILLIGNATKNASKFSSDIKEYDAEVMFGTATDTYDLTGTVIETGNPSSVDLVTLKKTIAGFTGDLYQIPPIYSARKVRGKRLYKYARQGQIVPIEPRLITIHSIHAECGSFPAIKLSVTCSTGTYIRSLAYDLGKLVGCPAHLSALRRTRAGVYSLNNALDFKSVVESGDATLLSTSIRNMDET
jgi:tRNA pseudouridine55 synthase